MRVSELICEATERLARAGCDAPALEAELLLAHVLGLERTGIQICWRETVAPEQRARFQRLVLRRARREPLAYILGYKEFYSRQFYIDRRVLVPRPETELLVDEVLAFCRHHWPPEPPLTIADIGTGSGIIAITLALALPRAKVYAVDASVQALEVAHTNVGQHGVADRVQILAGDLLSPLPGPVDVVVANLPYIGEEEWAELQPEVALWEPREALDGGPDGLNLIRRLLEQIAMLTVLPFGVFLEIGYRQGKPISTAVRERFPNAKIEVLPDYAGWDRIAKILLKPTLWPERQLALRNLNGHDPSLQAFGF